MPIRPATATDIAAIRAIAVETEMFNPDDSGFIDDVIAGISDGSLADHHFLVFEADETGVVGAAYFAPEPFSDRMWNLYFIAVSPEHQSHGIGGQLIDHLEHELRRAGPDTAQALIVETSSTEQYARTRQFYPRHGYVEEARIRRFYGPDDDKVVFWKSLTD